MVHTVSVCKTDVLQGLKAVVHTTLGCIFRRISAGSNQITGVTLQVDRNRQTCLTGTTKSNQTELRRSNSTYIGVLVPKLIYTLYYNYLDRIPPHNRYNILIRDLWVHQTSRPLTRSQLILERNIGIRIHCNGMPSPLCRPKIASWHFDLFLEVVSLLVYIFNVVVITHLFLEVVSSLVYISGVVVIACLFKLSLHCDHSG